MPFYIQAEIIANLSKIYKYFPGESAHKAKFAFQYHRPGLGIDALKSDRYLFFPALNYLLIFLFTLRYELLPQFISQGE